MKGVKNVLKIILIILLFPLFVREAGRYVEEICDDDMHYGGG